MTNSDSSRPACIGPDWLRCTTGYSFTAEPDLRASADRALASPNPWTRLLCVTLRAQAGEFGDVGLLLPIIARGDSVHLRDSAIRVFAQAAPSSLVGRLAEVFEHPDPDARIEAIGATILTTDSSLVGALVRHRAMAKGMERELTMDALSIMLEPDVEHPELMESPLGDEAFGQQVVGLREAIRAETGEQRGIYHGAPLDLASLAASLANLVTEHEETEPIGGELHERFGILEGMTGWAFAGCLDDDCTPVHAKLSHNLNSLRQSDRFVALPPGRRYFFGHTLP